MMAAMWESLEGEQERRDNLERNIRAEYKSEVRGGVADLRQGEARGLDQGETGSIRVKASAGEGGWPRGGDQGGASVAE